MKFSMMSYTMMRRGNCTVRDVVDAAVRLRIPGIDWVTTYGEKAETLRKLSDAAGLTVAAHTFMLRPGQVGEAECLESARRSIEDTVILGAPVAMIPPVPLPGVADKAVNRDIWCRLLEKVLPLAQEAGVILSVEFFAGAASAFTTAEDFFAAKKRLPDLKLTFDGANCFFSEDPVETLERCYPEIVHVHLKDWIESPDGGQTGSDGRRYAPALAGEGDVDSDAILRALKSRGYAGFINIEYEAERYPAEEAIARVTGKYRHWMD